MNNFEIIDDYLANRLNEQEMKAFEQQLAGDPSLKDEVDFQRQVIEGVKQARVLELKNMLNNVPVSGSGWSGGKVAAAVVSAGIVATSLYLYFKEEPAEVVAPDTATEQVTTKPEQPTDERSAVTTDEPKKEAEKTGSVTKEKPRSSASKPAPVVKPDLQVTDPSAELQEETDETSTSAARGEVTISKMEVLTEPADRKHNFHYQFVDGKLMLYGPFDKNLYEILEIHGNGHAVFLFYKENYYLLDEKETQVKPLEPIRDGQLLKKLKEYRGQ